MKKGQIKLLEQAAECGFSDEQIDVLKREDLCLNELRGIFWIFSNIKDFPTDKAIEYVDPEKGYVYRFYGLSYSDLLKIEALEDTKRDELGDICGLASDFCGIAPIDMYNLMYTRIVDMDNDSVSDIMKYVSSFLYFYTGNGRVLGRIKKSEYELIAYIADATIYYCINNIDKNAFEIAREKYIKNLCESEEDIKGELPAEYYERNYAEDFKERLRIASEADGTKLVGTGFLSYYMSILFGFGDDDFNVFKKCFELNIPVEDIAAERANDWSVCMSFEKIAGEHSEFLYDSDEQKEFVEQMLQTKLVDGIINIPYRNVVVNVPCVFKSPLIIKFESFPQSRVSDGNLKPGFSKYIVTLLVWQNGSIFYSTDKNPKKYRPAYFKEVVFLHQRYNVQWMLEWQLENLPAFKDNYVIRDLMKDYEISVSGHHTFPPIMWNECLQAYNRQDLMRKKLKGAECINFNKLGINAGYAYLKTAPYVDEASRGILYNAVTHGVIAGYNGDARGANVAKNVLCDYICNKLGAFDRVHGYNVEVIDYVNNCIQMKIPVSLRFRSLKKLIERNIELVIERQEKITGELIIPCNSVFNPLREALPKPEFEWIRSRDRILFEGRIMKHCVASYTDKVNKDKCAIYHIVFEGRPYTIEFLARRNKNSISYRVNQIQSKADRGCPEKLWDYVCSYVEKRKFPIKKVVGD